MVKNNDQSGYKILVIAISISLAWHILCLFSVNIVSAPMQRESGNFSKVSFLGPILSRVSMEVRATPAERSLLERRYRKMAGAVRCNEDEVAFRAAPGQDDGSGLERADTRIQSVIDEAVNVDKMEPDYPVE